MKKILLPALFCGFVLNNGCCFDAHHKITNEYLDGLFYRLVDENIANRIEALVMHKKDEFMLGHLNYVIRYGVEGRLANSLDSFLKGFLRSVIPYGQHRGRTVKDLLIWGRLYRDAMMTICDYSLNFDTSGREVNFYINDFGKITVCPSASNNNDFDISLTFLPLRETVRVR